MFTYQQKAPSSKVAPNEIFNKFYHSSLDDLQTLTLITLGFVGFLRWDDLTQLTTSDIVFYKDHAAVFLKKRKTASTGKGLGCT